MYNRPESTSLLHNRTAWTPPRCITSQPIAQPHCLDSTQMHNRSACCPVGWAAWTISCTTAQPGLYRADIIIGPARCAARLKWCDGDNSPELSLLSSRTKLINRCLMVGPCMPVQRFLPSYSMGRPVVQRTIRLSIRAEVGHPCGTYSSFVNMILVHK